MSIDLVKIVKKTATEKERKKWLDELVKDGWLVYDAGTDSYGVSFKAKIFFEYLNMEFKVSGFKPLLSKQEPIPTEKMMLS